MQRTQKGAKTVAEKQKAEDGGPITIKKYANRRLYNTATSSYVTLDHLCQMVKDGVEFAVFDAKSGDEITRSVLTQIIVEEEAKGQNLLPVAFLRQLISFYGDNLQWMVPSYLEHMMGTFSTNQDRMRQSMQETMGGMFPFNNLEDMSRQNMALFENAMKMFSPYGNATGADGIPGAPGPRPDQAKEDKPAAESAPDDTLDHLKDQVDQLQKQLNALSRANKKT